MNVKGVKGVKGTQINIKYFKENLINNHLTCEEVNLLNKICSVYLKDTNKLIVFVKEIDTELIGQVLE